LIGFIAAAFVLGTLISLGEKPDASRAILYATAVAASLFCVYLPGTLWLAHYLGISIPAAAGIATLPYIPLDLVKALLAVSLALPIRRRLKTAVR
jgi:biotin transporter BioY